MGVTPNPTPTAPQLVTLADILALTIDESLAAVSSETDQDMANAKWLATITDLKLWPELIDPSQSAVTRLGDMEFQQKDRDERDTALLNFRNKVRRRYGLTPLATAWAISSGAWF